MTDIATPESNDMADVDGETGWLVLTIDALRLAIPQGDSKGIELASALDVSIEEETEAGWFTQDGGVWPVYALDGDLSLRSESMRPWRFCVALRAGDGLIGLLCDQVRILPSEQELVVGGIPMCLRNPDSPIDQMALFENEILFVAGRRMLAQHLMTYSNNYDQS